MASTPKRRETAARASAVQRAPAKLNLYLHVVGRRADGYHELDSLVAFATVADVVSAAPAERLTLRIDGPFAASAPGDETNLVLRAARALAAAAGVERGAALTLTKNLPAAAGLGGGSADAAACLRALCAIWAVDLPPDRIAALALDLGADVPVCLLGEAAFVGGVGERLEVAPRLPPAALLLVNPGVPLPTHSVFRRFKGPLTESARFVEAPKDVDRLTAMLRDRRNDLEPPARELVPEIDRALALLRALPAARLARMTGSGASCFAIFASRAEAARAEALLRSAEPSWWAAAATFEGGV